MMKLVSWLSISTFLGGALLTGAVNERRLSHWAWQPLKEIEGSSTRSVDSFIEEKLKNNGLQLSPKAEPAHPHPTPYPRPARPPSHPGSSRCFFSRQEHESLR